MTGRVIQNKVIDYQTENLEETTFVISAAIFWPTDEKKVLKQLAMQTSSANMHPESFLTSTTTLPSFLNFFLEAKFTASHIT